MPTYEYECTKCGKVFELFQPITEPPRRRLKSTDPHPCDCNAPVIRLIGTGGGIIFKGSGFYQTDYRSESYKKAAKAEKEAGSNGKAKKDGTAKKETTPAKQETKAGTQSQVDACKTESMLPPG
ncbi:MAG: FmdB family zinc ribbon protein [Phycisphaerae bacterium]